MLDKAEVTKVSPELERAAARRARDRANAAKWNLDVAIFLFAVVIIVIILSVQGIGIEILAPVAVFGLAMVWLVEWRQGRQLYQRFYDEELSKLEQELKGAVTETVEKTVEKTIEERVQKALRARWK